MHIILPLTMKPVLVALLVIAACDMIVGMKNSKACLPPFGKKPFDEAKFSGQWYVVGRLATNALHHKNLTCSKIDYSVKEDGNVTRINMGLTMKIDGEEMKYMSTGQPMHHYMKSVLQTAWKKDSDTEWKGVIMQSVLATDYTTFAIYYACMPFYVDTLDTFDKMQVVNVWSRTPKMDDTLFKVLSNVLSSYDFDTEEMMQEDQTQC